MWVCALLSFPCQRHGNPAHRAEARHNSQREPGGLSTCPPDSKETATIYLSKLALTSFRNHALTRVDLGPGLSVFRGENGQGKSNLLEAAYLLAIAKSPRASSDRELVNWDVGSRGGHTQVYGVAREADTTVQAQIDIDVAPPGALSEDGAPLPLKKALRVNGIIRTAAEFVGRLNVVYFEARDLEIVTGGPSERRRFLDILISQMDPQYLKSLQRFGRVVMQRNQLLKRVRDGVSAEDEMEFWDERLSIEGAAIVEKRYRVVSALSRSAVREHAALTGDREDLHITYLPRLTANGEELTVSDVPVVPGERLGQTLREALVRSRGREIAQGMSVIGPHRDDLLLTVNGRQAGPYASRGQARSIALALKLAEASEVLAYTGRKPVLALDDVLSELDAARRRQVLLRTAGYEQALLTATEFELVDPEMLTTAARFIVEAGTVVPSGP